MEPTSPFPFQRGTAALGIALTLLSVLFFSFLGVTTQLAFDAGAGLGLLLAGRFIVAACVLWPIVRATGTRPPARRAVISGLLLGFGYSAHAWLFCHALARLDVGLVDMLMFTYPALVMLGAVLLHRERWSARQAAALAAATAGTTLVLLGGVKGIDPLGATLALACAVAYAGYILVGSGQLGRTDPLTLTALVATGAAITFTIEGVATNGISLAVHPWAIVMVAAVGLVGVGGMMTFISGIGALGASRASIISALQPAFTPILGFIIFGDRLGPGQVAGGALVIAGIMILELRGVSLDLRPGLGRFPRGERRIIRGLRTLELPAGTAVLRQGETGHALFVIERGRATVIRDGRAIALLRAGDVFGEIALLHDGVRTASVVADSGLRVRTLTRRDFSRTLAALPTLGLAIERRMAQHLGEVAIA
jgi:drug/metabolite transporter (DMT)-like permease